MKTEKFTKFHAAQIAFYNLLLKRDVDTVVISGFKNGTGGRVKIPESIIGGVGDSQLMFVKCSKDGFPLLTEKFVLARARGLSIFNASYLVAWADLAALPDLELYPVMCEWSHGAGRSVKLQPVEDRFFEGQSFTFRHVEHWRIKAASCAAAIEMLGGEMVAWEGRRGDNCHVISPVPIPGEVVFDPAWLANMIAVGRSLPGARWRREVMEEEDDFLCSQVIWVAFILNFLNCRSFRLCVKWAPRRPNLLQVPL